MSSERFAMMFHDQKILFIGAHPDDIELGCGALISHIAKDNEILCVTFSDNQGNPLLINSENLVEEHYRSMNRLGIPKNNIILDKFAALNFHNSRQDILEYMNKLKRTYKPDAVFMHSSADIHQDHNTLTEEALRAFRDTTLLGFEIIRSSCGFIPNFFAAINACDVEYKIKALAEYQTYSDKYYFNPDIIRANLIHNGALIGCPYAEGFDIIRVIEDLKRCKS
jgi:N-acetylglucosamine malate deacetylase 1